MIKNLFTSRKFRQGSMATAITVLTIAFIVVLNMVMSILSDRFVLSLDLTENNLFTISDESREFLDSLEKDVTIYVLNNEEDYTSRGTYYVQANEVIKNYGRASSRVSVQYKDIVKDPTFEALYPDLQLTSGTILVTSGDNAVVVSANDLFNYEINYQTYQQYIGSSKAEQTMATAILNVTSENKVRVTFLEGHSEDAMDDFKSLLHANNYEIMEENLVNGEVNAEATIAVIAAPLRDYTDDELRALDAFLENGGDLGKILVYFAAYNQPELPNLEAFLADWGILVEPGIVYELNSNRTLMNNPYIAVLDYSEQEYAQEAMAKSMFAMTANARPMSILFESRSKIAVEPLQQFSDTVVIQSIDADEEWVPTEDDLRPGVPALVLSTKTDYQNTTRIQSHVLTGSSYQAMSQSFLGMSSVSNAEYYLNLLNTLAGKEESIIIQDKTLSQNYMEEMTSGQAYALIIIFVILLPLAVLVAGMVIWLTRRHR